MRSMEIDGEAGSSSSTSSRAMLEPVPQRLNLKKPSVEDLKRLYEERLNTALGLARADAAKRELSL